MSVVDETLDFAGGVGFFFDFSDSFDLFSGTLIRSEACKLSSEVSSTAMVNDEARSDEL